MREKARTLNLLICGAMRSGTTSLKAYLSEHPEIGFVDGNDIQVPQELSGYYPFASPSLAQSQLGDDPRLYQSFCHRLAGEKTYIADKRAYFMFFPHIPFNLREQLPDIKLIFILRNPVEIVYSAFWQEKQEIGHELSFAEYLAESLAQVKAAASSFQRNAWLDHFRPGAALPNLVERGLYYPQITRFYRLFPAQQILVLRFDQLQAQPAALMDQVLKFLQLDGNFTFQTLGKVYNAAPAYPPMAPEIRARLQEIYAASNLRLLAFLGWPPQLWD